MKKLSRLLAVVLAIVLVAVTFAACKPATDDPSKTNEPAGNPTAAPYVGPDTLVVGYSRFSGKFSPATLTPYSLEAS